MDDTRKDKEDIPSISEDNWLTYFRSLHSNSPLGPIQQSIMNDLSLLELQKEQFPSLDYLITENEIFKAAKKLQNNKSAFSDKIKNEMIYKSGGRTEPSNYRGLFGKIILFYFKSATAWACQFS